MGGGDNDAAVIVVEGLWLVSVRKYVDGCLALFLRFVRFAKQARLRDCGVARAMSSLCKRGRDERWREKLEM